MHLLKTIPFRLFLFVSVRGNHIVSARISPFKGRSWFSIKDIPAGSTGCPVVRRRPLF
jgi:hypothetical protein